MIKKCLILTVLLILFAFETASFAVQAGGMNYSVPLDEWNFKELIPNLQVYGSLEVKNRKIKFAGNVLLALHVPGHSAGSIAYYCESDNCVFTGDALFAGSIGRTDLPGGNFDTLIKSIKTQLLTLPGKTVVYSGHGQETTIKHEADTNQYLT